MEQAAEHIAPETREEERFVIAATAATALALYRPRTLKRRDSFVVLDHHGDIQALGEVAEGLFHADTRHLSRRVLRLDGARPLLLSSAVSADNALLTVDLTNPDLVLDGGVQLPRDTVHLRRVVVVGDGALHERIHIRNYGAEPVSVTLTIEHGADFADIFEVRGARRKRRGTLERPAMRDGALVFAYRGLDGVQRETHLRFDPMPARMEASVARYALALGPGEQTSIAIAVFCRRGEEESEASDLGLDGWMERHRAWSAARGREVAQIETSNAAFNDWLARSRADLDMLSTQAEGGPFPYAGIPWFSTAFGRDSLITALQCLWMDPWLARGVLNYLAARQATESDPARDAEPGKILHETRRGEMAALGEVPFGLYYGSVDATPLFVMLAAAYLDRTGDRASLRPLMPNIAAALGWMAKHGDRDSDGFLEYGTRTPKGLQNQGWKDSSDAVFHADGRLADPPIALVEVQGYAYAAWLGGARIARALGQRAEADAWQARAEALRRQFDAAFWCPELGTYALALDGEKRPCRVRSSNAGHVLFSTLATPERAEQIAAALLDARSFCGWGVRTIAEGEARYNPMSYHNGSVWPHDNGIIALGFAKYGLRAPLLKLMDGLFEAAQWTEFKRLPELFCGFPRIEGEGPTSYPVACLPQAWASAASFALLGALLGVTFRPAERQILFVRPVLPAWLETVRIANLRLGTGSVDVAVTRSDRGEVSVTVLRRRGRIEVAVIS